MANNVLNSSAIDTGVLVSHAVNTASGIQTITQSTMVEIERKRRDLIEAVL